MSEEYFNIRLQDVLSDLPDVSEKEFDKRIMKSNSNILRIPLLPKICLFIRVFESRLFSIQISQAVY